MSKQVTAQLLINNQFNRSSFFAHQTQRHREPRDDLLASFTIHAYSYSPILLESPSVLRWECLST